MPQPTHILIDRISNLSDWSFRGAFWNFADVCLTASKLARNYDGAPVEYQILRWRDWTIAAEGMSQSRRTDRAA